MKPYLSPAQGGLYINCFEGGTFQKLHSLQRAGASGLVIYLFHLNGVVNIGWERRYDAALQPREKDASMHLTGVFLVTAFASYKYSVQYSIINST